MQPGQTLAHYTVVEKIGAGGMGEVYRATDSKLGRDVALKVLPAEFDKDPDRLGRFQREARTLASLQHPNVASVYGLETADGQTFLVMELVEGEDLSQRLSRGALAVDRVIDIAGQIATGLEAAHDKGIVHRDLKPANVKLGADGTVKILDFGLARAYEGDTEKGEGSATSPTMTAAMTNAGVILGTAAYMSPEQARGKSLDKRTDIFSFGTVLFEMFTGVRPFEGETLSDTLASVLKEHPDTATLPSDTPPALLTLLDRCLEKDPKKRLRDIGEARLILEAVQGGDSHASTILGKPPILEGTSPTRSQGIRPREIVAWAVAAITVIFLGTKMIQGQGASLEPQPAFKLSVPIEGETDLRSSHGGLAISPDGSRVAYINNRKLFIRRLDSWDPIEIPQTEGVSTPFWSPDGQWLAFAIDYDFWKIRPDGTQRTKVCTDTDQASSVTGGAWLADDRIAYRGEKDLMVVPASGGNPVTLFNVDDDSMLVDFHQPQALPHGLGLVTALHTLAGVQSIGIVAADGTLKTVLDIPDSGLAEPCYSPSGHILFKDGKDIWAVPFSLDKQEVTGDPFSVARNASIPSVSNDGTLTFVRNTGEVLRQLVLVDRTGKTVDRLGQPVDIWPAYSLFPDGTRAVAGHGLQLDVWLHDDRQARTRITFTHAEHDMTVFSWDGSTVFFATGTQNEYSIGSKAVGNNEPETTLVPPGKLGPHYYGACPAVSRDGRLLFYTAIGANQKQDIAWLDLNGETSPQLFLASEAAEYAARPSPADHRYVAYISEESGVGQVYLTTWPDAGQKLPVSIDGGFWPRWKADGTELFFAFENDIFVVEVSYEPLRLGRPTKLFSRPEYDDRQPYGWPATFDVTADGERFLVTELLDDANLEPSIAIIQNWGASLE
jgi:serine/threonine protein kinase